MSGALFLALVTLLCAAHFLVGLRFSRMPGEKFDSGEPGEARKARRMGRLFMLAAPLFWLLVAALCFGLLGPVDGIETIELTEDA